MNKSGLFVAMMVRGHLLLENEDEMSVVMR
jgi:hypothetical protein